MLSFQGMQRITDGEPNLKVLGDLLTSRSINDLKQKCATNLQQLIKRQLMWKTQYTRKQTIRDFESVIPPCYDYTENAEKITIKITKQSCQKRKLHEIRSKEYAMAICVAK